MESPVLTGLAGEGSTEAPTFDESDKNRLIIALQDLSELDRQIIDLRHTASMSFKQISELLDEPVGTLLARHHRALKKLKQILDSSEESALSEKKEDD